MDVFTVTHSDEYGSFDDLGYFDFDKWFKEALNRRLLEESRLSLPDREHENEEE